MDIVYWFFWPMMAVALGVFMRLSTPKNRDNMASIAVRAIVAVFVVGFLYEAAFP